MSELSAERYARLMEILAAALELSGEERERFVDEACGDDLELRERTRELLSREGAPSPLDSPAVDEMSSLYDRALEAAKKTTRSTPQPLPQISSSGVLGSLDEARESVELWHLTEDPAIPELHASADRYRTLKVLGEGGMGTVYLAHDRDLGRSVALKVTRKRTSRTTARFLAEAQVVGQLRHPGIVPVYDLGLTREDRLYYTMPVVAGRTLREIIGEIADGDATTRRTYSFTRRIQVFLQVTQAIEYAHARGVIHRDLKPENVMLGEHGEVQVLDWGLAKVLAREGAPTTAEPVDDRGRVLGTVLYMSPEQATGRDVGPPTDVYSLGVILYELLTLKAPFAGSANDIVAAKLAAEPTPPRRHADIPLGLEATCLRALARDPAARPTVAALHQEVQSWLEAETDRTRRHELAEAKAAEGRVQLGEYHRHKAELARLESAMEELAKTFESWRPADQKGELFAFQDRVAEARAELVHTGSALVGTLHEALAHEDDNATARGLLADYYWHRFLEAEAHADIEWRAFFRDRVADFHEGRYARELAGDGSLELTSEPAGAELWIEDLVEAGPLLVARNRRRLGTTPLAAVPLAMGSYLVTAIGDGVAGRRYPVHISRNRTWRGHLRLFTDAAIGDGFVHVPAGPFVQGGDPETRGWCLPRAEPEVDDFFIAEHPVTMAEYLVYLNALAATDPGLARRRSPRRSPEGGHYLEQAGDGQLAIPAEPVAGVALDPRWPVTAISWHDAVAYAGWRGERDGRAVRLPTATEWEKAARGVDGRWFPWGDRFDPSLCNMKDSQRGRTGPVAIDAFPTDVSVYGVRGLGGNIMDWTATERTSDDAGEASYRIVHGGSFALDSISCRGAFRDYYKPDELLGPIGFRLACSPPATDAAPGAPRAPGAGGGAVAPPTR